MATNPDVARRYFPEWMRTMMPRMGFQYFTPTKPEHSVRFVCLGGSTIAGFPYHAHASFGGLLGARLERLLPGYQIEPVVCAMTAINSHTVRDLMGEVLEAHPDFIVIYMGHNEFYGAGGVASVSALGRSPLAVRVARVVLSLRLSYLLRSLLPHKNRLRPGGKGVRNVMESMAKDRSVAPWSPLRHAAREVFRENLEAILWKARDAGVPVLLCEVASNLRDQPPFGSVHSPGFSEAARFDALMEEAEGLLRAAENAELSEGPAERSALPPDSMGTSVGLRLERARRLLREALEIDSLYARAHFLYARCLEALGDSETARRHYVAARDLDAVPFRAPSFINETIRQAASSSGATLVRVDSALFASASPRAPGEEFFLEHLHFNLRGNALVADLLVKTLYEKGIVVPEEAWDFTRALDAAGYEALAGVTDLDREIGKIRVHMLKQHWPYKSAGAKVEPYESEADSAVVAAAWAFVRKEVTLNTAHFNLGRVFLERGDTARAFLEFRSSLRLFPFDPNPAVAAARLEMHAGRLSSAARFALAALRAAPEWKAARGAVFSVVVAKVGSADRAKRVLPRGKPDPAWVGRVEEALRRLGLLE